MPPIRKKHLKITPDEKSRLEMAVSWIIDPEASDPHTGKAPTATQACRVYHLDEARFRNLIHKRAQRQRNQPMSELGTSPTRGGSNKILSPAQENVIYEYIAKLSTKGELGVTRELIYSAICSLLAKESPPRKPPSSSWLLKWLNSRKDILGLYKIRTKPVAPTSNISSIDDTKNADIQNAEIERICEVPGLGPSSYLEMIEQHKTH